MRKQALHPRTAMINKKQKNQSKQLRFKALQWLAEMFPSAFDNSKQIHPLKLGIIDDILVHAESAKRAGISKSKLREAVVVFTRRIDYLSSLKAQEMRIDLQGNPTQKVTAEEAERAASKLRKRVEKIAKNARKSNSIKQATSAHYHWDPSHEHNNLWDNSMGTNLPQNSIMKTTASTMITHKSSRQYDPDAVARLKEKLGLSRKKESIDK